MKNSFTRQSSTIIIFGTSNTMQPAAKRLRTVGGSAVATTLAAVPARDATRLTKRKVAIVYGYNGSGYLGSQFNAAVRDNRTLEGQLLAALHAAGAVADSNAADPSKIGFARASRTDKGVHACGNVAAAKLLLPIDDLVAKTNAALPAGIRVMDIFRVRGGFNPRGAASSRVYDYLLPWRVLRGNGAEPEEARLAQLQTLLGRFEGTLNYHNYTAGKEPNDASAMRFMISVKATGPFRAAGDDGTGEELVRVRLHGQSFLLHQIRKMMAMCVLVMRGTLSDAAMVKSLTKDVCRLPIAPGLPLALRRIEFREFQKHRPGEGWKEGDGDMSYSSCADAMDSFGDTVLAPWIARRVGKTYDEWLEYIEMNKDDVVQRVEHGDSADVTKTNKRNGAFAEAEAASGDA